MATRQQAHGYSSIQWQIGKVRVRAASSVPGQLRELVFIVSFIYFLAMDYLKGFLNTIQLTNKLSGQENIKGNSRLLLVERHQPSLWRYTDLPKLFRVTFGRRPDR